MVFLTSTGWCMYTKGEWVGLQGCYLGRISKPYIDEQAK